MKLYIQKNRLFMKSQQKSSPSLADFSRDCFDSVDLIEVLNSCGIENTLWCLPECDNEDWPEVGIEFGLVCVRRATERFKKYRPNGTFLDDVMRKLYSDEGLTKECIDAITNFEHELCDELVDIRKAAAIAHNCSEEARIQSKDTYWCKTYAGELENIAEGYREMLLRCRCAWNAAATVHHVAMAFFALQNKDFNEFVSRLEEASVCAVHSSGWTKSSIEEESEMQALTMRVFLS